jgi:hypothetical protein
MRQQSKPLGAPMIRSLPDTPQVSYGRYLALCVQIRGKTAQDKRGHDTQNVKNTFSTGC